MTNKFLRDDGVFAPLASSGSSASGPVTLLTKSTTADITNSSTSVYVDGPSVTQGSSGIWLVMGTATMSTTGGLEMVAKLWDGSTVIASCRTIQAWNTGIENTVVPLSGVIANPAGNLRISFASAVGGFTVTMRANTSGNSADTTITAIRIG